MGNLDNPDLFGRIDRGQIRNIFKEFPGHCRRAFRLGKRLSIDARPRDIKAIVFSAMGSSAIAAELANYYLRREINVSITVNRDYLLPRFAGRGSLVVLISYSGDTEETFSAYREARRSSARVVILSSGGRLADLAKADGCPCLFLPPGLPPREALAFLFLPILSFFSRMGLITDKEADVEETVVLLEQLRRSSLGIAVRTKTNLAKRLARKFFGNFCAIYGAGEQLTGVISRWRAQLAENANTISCNHVFPEMNHNEIVGWEFPRRVFKRFVAVMLRDKAEHTRVRKQIEIAKEILKDEGLEVEEVWSRGDSLLARIFSLIYIGDYASFYLAILNGVDPSEVKRIDYVKDRLRR